VLRIENPYPENLENSRIKNIYIYIYMKMYNYSTKNFRCFPQVFDIFLFPVISVPHSGTGKKISIKEISK